MKKLSLIAILLSALAVTSFAQETRVAQIYTESTTALGNGGVYTCTARDTQATISASTGTAVKAKSQEGANFKTIVVTAITDQASAALGCKLQASNNGSVWYTIAQGATVASTPLQLTAPLVARYYRVTLTNGATPQTSLFLASSIQK